MKKLFFFILFSSVFFIVKAQVLDTISLKEFKGLTHKSLKNVFSNNQEAIRLINTNRSKKLLAYGLYAATVPLVLVKNPVLILPLCLGFSVHGNNSKQNLYLKLLNLENHKFNNDSAKYYKPNKKNTMLYKFNHFVFDLSFEEFEALPNNQLKEMLLINDTIKYIFGYCKSNNEHNQSELWPSTIFIGGGVFLLSIGALTFLDSSSEDIPIQILLGGGGALSFALGVFLLPPKRNFKHQNIQMQTYYVLRQYFTTHKMPKELVDFMSVNKKQ